MKEINKKEYGEECIALIKRIEQTTRGSKRSIIMQSLVCSIIYNIIDSSSGNKKEERILIEMVKENLEVLLEHMKSNPTGEGKPH